MNKYVDCFLIYHRIRGFGKTVKKSGSKGVSSFSATFSDIKTLIQMTKIEGKPIFMMGHSMG